jgi:hypothetical protein
MLKSFDFTQLASISGIETIQGSDVETWIRIKASQLSDIRVIDGGVNVDGNGSPLHVEFNEHAQAALVQEVLRALTYQSASALTGERSVTIEVSDANFVSVEATVVIA